ncbi:MAG: FKBP-type peptidyl-prolyl cis-trans isomerase [Candidatus Thermoplasmatota archaeon]|nr:FKBP-type peptidyl-prolyl cis-trans isomerase [Candidatus Thermoplasmatota archaeon]MBS3789644.1 FKBP-type peptidyl-prolyl cis-trans isomerase [Candidatus Thermoplasmatota archaeon]
MFRSRGMKMAVEEGDVVEVDYTGKLKDGTIFDSSIEEKAKESEFYDESRDYEPFSFTVGEGEVIPGFEEGVKGMEVGEKKEIEIPPERAYGEEGDHPLAGKTLIFELEVKNKSG